MDYGRIWYNTDKEMQKDNLKWVIETIKTYKDENGREIPNVGALREIWKNTDEEAQRENPDILKEIVETVKTYKYGTIMDYGRIWYNTDKEMQKDNLKWVIETIKTYKDENGREIPNTDALREIWENTDKEVQKDNFMCLVEAVKTYKDENGREIPNTDALREIWENTDKEVQKDNFMCLVEAIKTYKDENGREIPNTEALRNIWVCTDKEVQKDNFMCLVEAVKTYKDENGREIPNTDTLEKIIENTYLNLLLNLPENYKKTYFLQIFKQIKQMNSNLLPEFCKEIPSLLKGINKNIDTDKLSELVLMRDNEYLNEYIINNIIVKNINNSNMDIDKINNEISKIHNTFFTNDLPETFKLFEFFKFHKNYNSSNVNLYSNELSLEDRDKIILQDLFGIALDSNNKQMMNFLELLHEGDLTYKNKEKKIKIDELEKAKLLSYRDTLYSLYGIEKTDHLERKSNFYEDIDNLRNKLQLKENENLGDKLLNNFLQDIGFKFKDGIKDSESISSELLDYMWKKQKEAMSRNMKKIDTSKLLEERRSDKRY